MKSLSKLSDLQLSNSQLSNSQITELAKPLVRIITEYYEKEEHNHGNIDDQ